MVSGPRQADKKIKSFSIHLSLPKYCVINSVNILLISGRPGLKSIVLVGHYAFLLKINLFRQKLQFSPCASIRDFLFYNTCILSHNLYICRN